MVGFAAKIIFTFLLLPAALLRPGEVKVSPEVLRSDVEFLSDSLCTGRATGTAGSVEAAAYIVRRLTSMGYSVQSQAFGFGSDRTGHNLVASSPAAASGDVILLMANYDGLGTIGSRIYPGADSNASGVAALLSLAEKLKGRGDIVFAFTDARNAGSAGAKALKDLLKGRRIKLAASLEIIGSSLAAVDEYWPDYLIVLGGERFRSAFERCNRGLQLHLYYQYYRSRSFTELFYRRSGDQSVFLADGIPSLLFTSGITHNTNKLSDTSDTLDYDIFARRVEFICRFISDHARR